MSSPWFSWQSFWFTAAPLRRLGLFRIAIVGYALIDIALVLDFTTRYARVSDIFFEPIILVQALGRVRLDPGATTVVHVVCIVSLAAALVGLLTRVSLIVGSVTYTWLLATYYSFGKVDHGRITIVIAMWAMTIAPAGGAYALDEWRARRRSKPLGHLEGGERVHEFAGWALRLVSVLVVGVYFLSGVAKLRDGGLEWITGGALQVGILANENALGRFLLSHASVFPLLHTSAVAFELGAPLALLGDRPRNVILAVAGTFHIAVFVVLDIDFWGLMICYLAFFRLEMGVDHVLGWAKQGQARRLNDRRVALANLPTERGNG